MITACARRVFTAALTALLFALASPSIAQQPDATIELDIYKAGFIVGGSAGSGLLNYKGVGYPLRIAGISLGPSVTLARAELIGEVFDLKRVEDIEGTYTAVSAGVAAAGGGKVAELKNAKGVKIRARGRQMGVDLSIDLSGMQVTLR